MTTDKTNAPESSHLGRLKEDLRKQDDFIRTLHQWTALPHIVDGALRAKKRLEAEIANLNRVNENNEPLVPATGSALEKVCLNCYFWNEHLLACYHAPSEPCPPECSCDGWKPNTQAEPRRNQTMNTPNTPNTPSEPLAQAVGSADTSPTIRWHMAHTKGVSELAVKIAVAVVGRSPQQATHEWEAENAAIVHQVLMQRLDSMPCSATRPHVIAFAREMESRLEQNRHKGDRDGWLALDMTTLQKLLSKELDELEQAMSWGDANAVFEEAADVANFAMMIADKFAHQQQNEKGQA